MNLTRDHIPLLQAARELIDSGKQTQICVALGCVEADEALFDACAVHIVDGLRGYAYLTSWARAQMPDPVWWLREGAIWSDSHRREEALGYLRMLRLAWLDKIIHDIEEQPC